MAALFNQPRGIANDGTNLYFADTLNNCIRQMSLATGIVTTIAGSPGKAGGIDGAGTAALFDKPYALAVDVAGNCLYVADTLNYAVRMISLDDRVVTTVAGMIGAGGHVDGTGSAARFSQFQGIAFDSSRSLLYVADTGSSTIRMITVPGYSVTTIAGHAYALGSTDGATGIGTDAQFHDPCGITVDPAGAWIYVADTSNNTIRFIRGNSPWPVTTIAGAAGNAGNSDGVGPMARFDLPRGIATDGLFLIVSDASNDTIRKIEISTAATTTLAGRPRVPGSADGLSSAALFSSPCGIAEGRDWRSLRTCLYIADAGNNTIREALQ